MVEDLAGGANTALPEILTMRRSLRTGQIGIDGALERLRVLVSDPTERAKWGEAFRKDQQVWWDEQKRWSLGSEIEVIR